MKIYWSYGKPYVERGSRLVELTPIEVKELYESHTQIEEVEDDFID
jgi:hypothetical protein